MDSPEPSESLNPNKDWEDLQRDCAIFPAWTDYLYGPDTRPQLFDSTLLVQPYFVQQDGSTQDVFQSASSLPDELHWVAAEEATYDYYDSSNDYPGPRGLTPPFIQPPITAEGTVPIARMYHGLPSNPSPNSSTEQFGDDYFIEGVENSHINSPPPLYPITPASSNPIPSSQTTQEPTQQQVAILKPGDMIGSEFRGIPNDIRTTVDTKIIIAWKVIQNPQADQLNKDQAKQWLMQITKMAHTHHANWVMRYCVKKAWNCLTIRQHTPPEHPEHIMARDWMVTFIAKLTPAIKQRIQDMIQFMIQAEAEGRSPLQVLEDVWGKDSFGMPQDSMDSLPLGQDVIPESWLVEN